MRMGEKCPSCGRQETVNWLPSTWDVEKDVAPRDSVDLSTADPQFAYKISNDGQYVIRILKPVLVARCGKWNRSRAHDKNEYFDSDKQVKRRADQ